MTRISTVGSLILGFMLCAVHASAEDNAVRVLHLDEAIKTALAHGPPVIQARAATEAARGRVDQARAGLLPQVTGTASYQKIHSSGAGRPITTTAPAGTAGTAAIGASSSRPSTYDLFSAGLNATQLLWDFGQTYNRTRAAGASRDALQTAERTARAETVQQVRRAFFLARAQRALVKVGEESVANQTRHLEQVQGFVAQGIRPDIDLAQARADLASARLTLINARSNYATARAQLNQVMGVFGPSTYDVADEQLDGIAGEDEPVERLMKNAFENRPEVMTLERQRRAAELTLSSLRGAYGPTLNAVGGISEAGFALDSLGTNWNVGLNLIWPIFQGGLTRGQTREAAANIDVSSAQLSAQKLSVRVEIEQALFGIQAGKASIEAARDALVNAQERLRLAEGRYAAGVGSIIELDDAQLALTTAAAQLVQSEYTLATARADLLFALGR